VEGQSEDVSPPSVLLNTAWVQRHRRPRPHSATGTKVYVHHRLSSLVRLVNQEKKTELTFHPTLNKRKPLCSGLHLLIDDLFRWGPSRFFWLSTRKLRRIASVAGTDSHFSRRRTPLFELPRVRAPDSGTPDVMPPTPPVYQSRSCRGCGQRSRLKLRRCRFRSPPPRQCRHRCGCRVGPVHRTYPNRVLGRPAWSSTQL
jgi:hypothetical protein